MHASYDRAPSVSRWERPLLAGGGVAGVMFLAAMGLLTGVVASLMPLEAPAVSAKTVANYVSSILGKLQVADRAEAVRRAREAGLGA